MSRYCASCGTEVDDTAIFCPTCGQPIDQEVEAAIPPAPAWPDPSDVAGADAGPGDAGSGEPTRPLDTPPAEPAGRSGWESEPTPSGRDEPPVPPAPQQREYEPIRPVSERRYEAEPEPAATATPPAGGGAHGEWERRDQPGPADAPSPRVPASSVAGGPAPRAADPGQGSTGPGTPAAAPSSPLANLPVTAPVTLSGWLIGVGAVIAAIGALISLFDGVGAVVDILLLVALAGVALGIFFSASLPAMPLLRLATLAIVLVAFGAGLDRLLTGAAGAGELLLFLGTAAAVIGALLVELGRDQPLGGPQS